MKKVFLFLILIFSLVSCNNEESIKKEVSNKSDQKIEKIKITTSIIPLASISNYIG
jgi:PBP1b-binding outer membrane lipoprotein LpoB